MADQICIDITRDVMKLMDEGKRLKDISLYIEKTHSKKGPGTPTPPVPENFKDFWPVGKEASL